MMNKRIVTKRMFSKPHVEIIKVSSKNNKNETVSLKSAFCNLRIYFSHYCNASTIHGLKYVGEPGRVIWLGVVVIVCIFCSFLISLTYAKWKNSPVMVSFDISDATIDSMPFPAVTICPPPQFILNGFNLTDVFLRKSTIWRLLKRSKFKTVSINALLRCAQRYADGFQIASTTQFIREEDLNKFFEDIPEWVTFRNKMTWIGEVCNYTLKKILTKNGVCFTFNMLSLDEILSDVKFVKKPSCELKAYNYHVVNGYTTDRIHKVDYPKRTYLAGPLGGFQMNALITNMTEVDYLCEEGLAVFKIALHNSYELPNMDKHFLVPRDQALFVAVTPKAITYSESLKSYPPSIRNCYFYNEKMLLLYRIYTQENCLNECLVNATLSNCGCVPFYMPRVKGSKICGPGSVLCVQNSTVTYLRGVSCGCLPLCRTMWYDIETTETEWNSKELTNVMVKYKSWWKKAVGDLKHFSKLHVFFKEMQFLPAKRQEFYDFTDFVSKVGGLLGLCIGLSVVSVIEILHFCTLRIICNIRRYGRKLWTGTVTRQ
ncbi:hypothetical protein FQR65_LT01868 [Abscondita terminalis]|nr:hypothetical protein FQR65_LT01868 [Abscondita terminalis]